jgi:hypothetical protein
MALNKTIETLESVADFIGAVADEQMRADSFRIVEIMEAASGFPAKMWGPAIVGFGRYRYCYESGRKGDAPLAGFSPRKEAISLYLSVNQEIKDKMLAQLGKHKAAKSCIYIKKLDDISIEVLKEMVRHSVINLRSKYPE